ncbi:MAG: D-tyrosyl-tRNA(Tyr) deacylase [Ruminococcaceae bacterium]|nr:D-tyrosyl-tRNA(Tyr) deacylase [Oscillospiraceae bacterium]
MKIVIQRVKKCSLKADGVPFSETGRGLLVLVGVREGDCENDAVKLVNKLAGLRIFEDLNGKMNLNITDFAVNGDIMAVSNFTLYGDCRKGRRPDFVKAAKPDEAKHLYEYFVGLLREQVNNVQTGVFGADMEIDMIADGPVTFIIESSELA